MSFRLVLPECACVCVCVFVYVVCACVSVCVEEKRGFYKTPEHFSYALSETTVILRRNA